MCLLMYLSYLVEVSACNDYATFVLSGPCSQALATQPDPAVLIMRGTGNRQVVPAADLAKLALCGGYPAFLSTVTMFSLAIRRAAAVEHVVPRFSVRVTAPHGRRYIQTAMEAKEPAEAYLEEARPGITFLSLNRPKAKNAISRRLLQVSFNSTGRA